MINDTLHCVLSCVEINVSDMIIIIITLSSLLSKNGLLHEKKN